MNTKLAIILILALAFILRIIGINDNPPAMYGDELTMVLDVNSILHTGFDTTGKFLPLNFSMGGGRPVGYGYFSMPFVAIFGIEALSVRLLSVLSGVGIVFLIYFLGKLLFSKNVGLLASVLMAVSPWNLSLSRGGFETHFALFLSLLGIVMFLLAEKKPWLYIISAVSFGLSINTYSTYKLNLPLFIPFMLGFVGFRERFSNKNRSHLLISVGILSLFIILLIFQALLNNSEERFLSLNIFSKEETNSHITQIINEQRNLSSNNKITSLILHNKFWEYGLLLMKSYLNNFSLDFLFLSGDKNPRHNMVSSGSFYFFEIITIFIGLGYLFRKEYSKKITFLIGWLLIAPLATTLLLETHALRSSFILPPIILLSALGLYSLWNLKKSLLSKSLIFLIVFIFLIQFIFICENLYFLSPNKYSRFWAYPAKKASQIAIENREKYDYIFISDRIDAVEFAFPIYAKVDPSRVLEQNKNQTKVGEYKFRKYGNVYIGDIRASNIQAFPESLDGSVLYIGPESDGKYLQGIYADVLGKDQIKSLVHKEFNK